MKRALLVLLFATASASAQPAWNPNSGWNPDFDQTTRQMNEDYQKRVAEMNREHDNAVRKMDADFDRDTHVFGGIFGFVFAVMFIGVVVGIVRQGRRNKRVMYAVPDAVLEPAYVAQLPSGTVDVSVLRLAVDGRAGKLVVSELDRLGKQFETTSADGRSQLLRELGVVLRRVRSGWLYGGAVNEPMRSLPEARAVAAKHSDDARVHGSDAGDGTGVVVVTVVLTARGELMSVDHIGAEELRRALEAAAYRDPNDVLDISIVTRRFASRDELESAYPTPQLVALFAPGGSQMYCHYCGGPFPAELTTCPHCGAPAKRERAA